MNNTTERKSPPERPPPPIVIHGKAKDHAALLQFCKKQAGENFTIKYTRERTIISTKTKKEYNSIKEKMEQDELEYHTYTTREEKTHAFVLHGLDKGPEIPELVAEMKEKGVDLINMYEMKNTQRPLFLVITGKYETLNSISKKCPALSHIRVSFHRYVKKTRITQCHRCQEWGHATSNCRVKPKCLKCAEGHWTRDCEIGEDATPKSTNKVMTVFHDEIEIEDFEYDEEEEVYYYPCPCGDRFQISKEELLAGEEVATCPSCSLVVKVIYDQETFQEEQNEVKKLTEDLKKLEPSVETDYLLILKQDLIDHMQLSPSYLKLPHDKNKQPEQEIDKLVAQLPSVKEKYDWTLFPSELRPKVLAKRVAKKVEKNVDVQQKLTQLEQLESDDKVAKDDDEEENVEDDEIVEEEQDEEMDDGTDYANNYFDNGEDYEDEDDNLDDGPIY
ncbi:hypothetical protein TcasGA2_TC033736 [Tribolium castaneum]|uniref:Diphthamide biosynthesis protein 3 n=1 Tax=Tribolium castaneum TaxID=7070 RepID=A0A139WF46_TRICA|nr:hypothetical protein TcasGA2_TC033736 [Tribolium castaneum]